MPRWWWRGGGLCAWNRASREAREVKAKKGAQRKKELGFLSKCHIKVF